MDEDVSYQYGTLGALGQMRLKFWALFDIEGAFNHVKEESTKFILESKKLTSNKLQSNKIMSQYQNMENKMNSRNDLLKSVKQIKSNSQIKKSEKSNNLNVDI